MSEDKAKYLPYDETDPRDIERYAALLVGRTLREALPKGAVLKQDSGKGNFGNLVERNYFGLTVGSSPSPDFEAAGIELKVTPLKRIKSGALRAKERLVLQMIDFDSVRHETWDRSSFLKKNARLLLVFYEWEQGADPLDYRFRIVRLWEIPAEDLPTVKADWQTIVEKIRAKDEEGISGGDTVYLEACTKAATGASRRRLKDGRLVKPRAWAFKGGYMSAVIDSRVKKRLKSVLDNKDVTTKQSLENEIKQRFKPYIGLPADEIAQHVGVSVNESAKHYHALLTKAVVRGILGVLGGQRIAEFEKAEILMRTIRLKPNGMPKEAVSFPAFDYFDLIEQEWEESDLRTALDRRFFFVIYQLDSTGMPTLKAAEFWTMPRADLDLHVRQCFDETIKRIRSGRASELPASRDNRVCHVRPHARNKLDTLPTPGGGAEVKKSFWLNQRYLKSVLADLI